MTAGFSGTNGILAVIEGVNELAGARFEFPS